MNVFETDSTPVCLPEFFESFTNFKTIVQNLNLGKFDQFSEKTDSDINLNFEIEPSPTRWRK